MEKKGVSPLIATVLLLAFAVALATVIININPFGGCTAKVQISKLNGLDRICYQESTGMLEMFVSNEDQNRGIAGFIVRISGEANSENPESTQVVEPLREQRITVPYDLKNSGNILQIKVSAKVNLSNRIQACDMATVAGPIPNCK
jgi:flagellin-like protein